MKNVKNSRVVTYPILNLLPFHPSKYGGFGYWVVGCNLNLLSSATTRATTLWGGLLPTLSLPSTLFLQLLLTTYYLKGVIVVNTGLERVVTWVVTLKTTYYHA